MKYHYTIENLLKAIAQTGYLQPATRGINPGEKPVVWFTTRPEWEPTATKLFVLPDGRQRVATMSEMITRGGGLIRIEVADKTAPHSWKQWRRKSGVSRETADALEEVAMQRGSSVKDWWVSFERIPKSKFVEVVKYVIPPETMALLLRDELGPGEDAP